MDYLVTHVTRFEYEGPVYESSMEVRLVPRADGRQTLKAFDLTTRPGAALFGYSDAFGNDVRHFDIIQRHDVLEVEARMRVRTTPAPALPASLDASAWDTLASLRESARFWDFFEPSPRVPVGDAVRAFADACGLERAADPLTAFRRIAAAVHGALVYAPQSTTVDTPIEAAIEARRGVCQDFSHVTLALARAFGIPCRYVSGYLAPASERSDRALMSHAWVEAWMPGLEWTAFDPTHDMAAGERHIAVAVGRDYGDAAPTRGVFRGGPAGTLSVTVRIEPDSGLAASDEMQLPPGTVTIGPPPPAAQRNQ